MTEWTLKVKVKRLDKEIPLPKYAYHGDAGMDVCSKINYILPPGEHSVIPTGLSFAIPEGYEMQVRPRSGLAAKQRVTILNSPGTIDQGYRGELGVVLMNHGKIPFEIKKGDRIAQIVFSKVETTELIETEELPPTERGKGGFGSSGIS